MPSHPGGMPASNASGIPPGCVHFQIRSGGIAALNPRLMAGIPFGMESRLDNRCSHDARFADVKCGCRERRALVCCPMRLLVVPLKVLRVSNASRIETDSRVETSAVKGEDSGERNSRASACFDLTGNRQVADQSENPAIHGCSAEALGRACGVGGVDRTELGYDLPHVGRQISGQSRRER